MKKIFTLFAAILCGLAMNAKTIYLNTGGSDLWETDGANHFAVWHWQGSGDGQWSSWMTHVTGNVWSAEIADASDQVVFCRFNNAASAPAWGSDMWNQTEDLTPGTNDLFTITGWGSGKSTGSWSVYDPNANPGGGDTPDPEKPNAYWYYKGYIDGANLENEQGGYNIFKCGTASLDVEEDAYIFLIYQVTGVQGEQYMTATYVDGPDHATMLKTGNEKFHLGAGSYTLYLYDNGDGSVELSTAPMAGKTLISDCEQAIENTPVSKKAYKTIINGQLVIIRGEKMFDATGRQL